MYMDGATRTINEYPLCIVIIMFIHYILSIFSANEVDIFDVRSGALYSLRYPLVLQGNNIFERNIGGAITLIETEMVVYEQLLLEKNMAVDGGGLSMFGDSVVSNRLMSNLKDPPFFNNNSYKCLRFQKYVFGHSTSHRLSKSFSFANLKAP